MKYASQRVSVGTNPFLLRYILALRMGKYVASGKWRLYGRSMNSLHFARRGHYFIFCFLIHIVALK
jgi:hypothetical protein